MSETTTNRTIKATKTQKTVEKQTVMYVGASLNNGRLHQFSVFNNGFPAFLTEDIEKCPAIKALMVPILESGEARQRLSQQGTAEHTLNSQIIQYVRSEN